MPQTITFEWTDPDGDNPATDVLLRLQTLADNAHDDHDLSPYLMEQEPSGLWSLRLELDDDLRSSYQFCAVRQKALRGRHPDDEEYRDILALGIPDTTNPDSIGPSTFPIYAPASVLSMPDAIPQPWFAKRSDIPTGSVTRHELDDESAFWLYVPASTPNKHEPMPLVVLFDGKVWMGIDVVSTFDNLIADGAIPPTAVAIVDTIKGTHRRVWLTQPDVFMPFLLETLIPLVSERVRVTSDPGRTVVAGQSLGGLAAAYIGLHAPERFGLVLSQSGSYWWPGMDEREVVASDLISAYVTSPRADLRFFVEAGSLERNLVEKNRHLRDVLLAKGYPITYREFSGGHDYACWRGGLADGLIDLLSQGVSP